MIKRVCEKYGWLVLLFLGLMWLVVGLNQIFVPDELIEKDVQHVTDMSLNELEVSSPEAIELGCRLPLRLSPGTSSLGTSGK